jgi:peptidoglycan/xylan/chitin deacetylase (PgdA/CDA1 family)
MRKNKLFLAGACVALIAISCSKEEAIRPESQNQLKAGSVYLCFDDGPCSNSTTLVSKLKSAGATATFFIWGNRISGNMTSFNAIKNAGYSIQNHSYTHSHMTSWSYSQVYNDLNQCQTAIKNQGCPAPKKVRLPYLESNSTIQSACSALDLAIVSPTVYSNDWNGATTAQIVSSVSGLQAGGNPLMHDRYTNTNNAIAQIVTNLKNKGFSFAKY